MKNFGKRFLTVLVLALVIVLPAQAFAEVGIQLGVPYQGVTQDANLKSGGSGSRVLLTFGLDGGTSVGILNEQINVMEGAVAGSYNVNAIRLSKDIGDQIFVAIDLGSASSATKQASLADIVFGARLMGSKGKISSFFNVEIDYRLMNPGASMIGGAATNYGGIFLGLGAGLTF